MDETVSATARADTSVSPTTSIQHVLITLAVSLILGLLLGARGIVHSANGMPDGPQRAVALAVGRQVLQIAEVTRLTWPWDHLQAALGRNEQPSVPPLLLAGSGHSSGGQTWPVRVSADSDGSEPVSGTSTKATATNRVSRQTTVKARINGRSAQRRPMNAAGGRLTSRRPPAQPPHVRLLTRPTPRSPLRLLVTGDSLMEFFGPELVNEASRVAPVRGFVDTHYGTGLVRPDFVDWSLVARQQVAADHPDAVVVFLGGNDFQNISLAGGRTLLSGTPAWTQEYARRAEICMRIWTQGGARRVYWVSLPPARSDAWARHNAEIDVAVRLAARRVPGAEYLDITGPITDHGRYADFVYAQGQPVPVRAPDGIHLTVAGSTIVAHEVLQVLEREWHLRSR